MKHTPGPWNGDFYVETEETEIVALRDSYVTSNIAMVYGGLPEGQSRANAYLFIAAPELLEALEEATLRMASLGQDTSQQRAAIAKAKGEQLGNQGSK